MVSTRTSYSVIGRLLSGLSESVMDRDAVVVAGDDFGIAVGGDGAFADGETAVEFYPYPRSVAGFYIQIFLETVICVPARNEGFDEDTVFAYAELFSIAVGSGSRIKESPTNRPVLM